jgi:putative sugar O-methyltransferase
MLENFRNNGLTRGTDNSYLNLNKETLFRSKNLEEKLNFADISFEEIEKFLLKENIGNSKNLLKIKDYYISDTDFKNYERLRDFQKFCFSKKNINLVCEIGGGFGELGRMIMIDQPNIKYFFIDLPETNLLCHYYISKVFPNKKIFLNINCKNNSISRSDVENNDVFILNPWIDYQNIKFDLFINAQSMMEMKPEIIKKYFNFIQSSISKNGFFYLINRYYHDGTGSKNILSEYPYDAYWNVIISKLYKYSKRSHVILLQRSDSIRTNFKLEMEKIKNLQKNFSTPNLPLWIINLYRKIKKFFVK